MWSTSNTSPNQVKFTFDFTQLRFFWAASSLSFVATWNMSAWRVITNIPSVWYSWTHTPGIPWSWNFSDKLLWERRTNHAAIRHSPEVSKPSMEFEWRSEEIWPKKNIYFTASLPAGLFCPSFAQRSGRAVDQGRSHLHMKFETLQKLPEKGRCHPLPSQTSNSNHVRFVAQLRLRLHQIHQKFINGMVPAAWLKAMDV